jgi:hypothetical protein
VIGDIPVARPVRHIGKARPRRPQSAPDAQTGAFGRYHQMDTAKQIEMPVKARHTQHRRHLVDRRQQPLLRRRQVEHPPFDTVVRRSRNDLCHLVTDRLDAAGDDDLNRRRVQREFARYACDMRRLMRRIMVEQEQDTLRHDGIRLSRRIRKLAPNSSSKVTVSASTLDQAAPIAPIVGSIR